jgi:hypothetical protein
MQTEQIRNSGVTLADLKPNEHFIYKEDGLEYPATFLCEDRGKYRYFDYAEEGIE